MKWIFLLLLMVTLTNSVKMPSSKKVIVKKIIFSLVFVILVKLFMLKINQANLFLYIFNTRIENEHNSSLSSINNINLKQI